MTAKEIKSEIRELRKVKLQCRSGTPERIKLHHKITVLKKQLKEMKDTRPEDNTPLEFKPKGRPPKANFIGEDCPDNNGCSYFCYCKSINKEGQINKTCYNPLYILTKLNNQCNQLVKKMEGE